MTSLPFALSVPFTTVALLGGLLAFGCGGTSTDGGDGGSDSGGGSSGGGSGGGASLDWQVLHECQPSDPDAPIEVASVGVQGDTLTAEVSHGGGCEEHQYGLCWDGEWAESEPVQVRLEVLHEDNDDGCDAYLTQTVTFDLEPLAEEYVDRYGTGDAAITLLVGDESVRYEFGTPRSPTAEEVALFAEEINFCEEVSDCEGVGFGCDTLYVNAASAADLEAMIVDHQGDYPPDTENCDVFCACGLLSCTEGRCVTRFECTNEPPAGSEIICL